MRGNNTSAIEYDIGRAQDVSVTNAVIKVTLKDGRTLSVPTAWYPRLQHATPAERAHWRFIGDGEGIHWPDLDEDISIAGLLMGKPSGENLKSLERWLKQRTAPSRGK